VGESATVLCAVAFACQILLVGRLAPRAGNPLAFAAGQIVVAAICLSAAGIIRGEWFGSERLPRGAISAALFTGTLATAFAFLAQTWAQRRVSPSVVAVCFASEPVFAALVSVLIYGDRLGPVPWVGAFLVTLAMAVAALEPGLRACPARSPAGSLSSTEASDRFDG
jgi:drug/metabolite transporter (DMT)-like permease